MAARAARRAAKELTDSLVAARKARAAEARARREERQKRREENELKATTYQVLSDPSKIKKMTKATLRQIKRTRVNERGVVELVPVYSK
jgi:hypothetical protein